jgi:hypothetical protein
MRAIRQMHSHSAVSWHGSSSSPQQNHPGAEWVSPAFIVSFVVALCCAITVGCSGNTLDTVAVNGTVTLDGTPLENGVVRFVPVDSVKGRLATGTIKPGGGFVLSTAGSSGVLRGEYRISIESMKITDDVPEKDRELGIGGKTSAIPVRYNDAETSELTEKIDGSKKVTLELKSS